MVKLRGILGEALQQFALRIHRQWMETEVINDVSRESVAEYTGGASVSCISE